MIKIKCKYFFLVFLVLLQAKSRYWQVSIMLLKYQKFNQFSYLNTAVEIKCLFLSVFIQNLYFFFARLLSCFKYILIKLFKQRDLYNTFNILYKS